MPTDMIPGQPPPASPSRPIPTIDHRRLEKLRLHLVWYAKWLLGMKPLPGPIGQLDYEDLASDAIIIALENSHPAGRPDRIWEPEKCSLPAFCRGVIRSKISNTRKSKEMQLGRDTGGDLDPFEEAFVDRDLAIDRSRNWKLLFERLVGDPLALTVLDVLLENPSASSRAIASQFGFTVLAIENARQRIKRHGQKIAGGAQ